eukprot:6028596-Alexandrium_andersonii.AAC.1
MAWSRAPSLHKLLVDNRGPPFAPGEPVLGRAKSAPRSSCPVAPRSKPPCPSAGKPTQRAHGSWGTGNLSSRPTSAARSPPAA